MPGEIVPGDEFYSYADKYEARRRRSSSRPRRSTDAQVDARRRRSRSRAFEACRCEAMARVDLFLDATSTGAGSS